MIRSKTSSRQTISTSSPVSSRTSRRSGVFEALARFHDAARQRPPAFERFAAALDQQDAVAFDNDERAHAQDREVRDIGG